MSILSPLWKVASGALISQGLMFSAELLSHSLERNPSDLDYDNNSRLGNAIRKTEEYNDLLTRISEKLSSTIRDSYEYDDKSVAFGKNDDIDLYLAIHGTHHCYVKAERMQSNLWKIDIQIVDVYDFKFNRYDGIVNGVANWAAYSQLTGDINPYTINVNLDLYMRA